MNKLMMYSLLILLSTEALGDSIIVNKTHSWQRIPITINAEKKYVVEGTVPEGNFYYTYPGYRCIKEKTNIVGVNAVVYHAEVPGQSDIYCYPE
ncbi:secreted protein [Legionella wadsworthii]|uniref:Secreted protein n=1 Tax=Legionella wadsworthii TaxID=28088 RepID=A0A378LR47_9GAMM|nr:hypothetical protein [Legionella wadsworthii]STY28312.1 secreted protein [Legionella wadsworthii]